MKGNNTLMPTKARIQLPESEKQALVAAREAGDLVALRQRVLALRQAGWPLRAIGDPLNTGRSTARMWELHADPKEATPSVTQCPRGKHGAGERVVRMRLDVPPSERDELKRLALSARKVRGSTPQDAQERRDAKQLEQMIKRYVHRGVPVKRIAGHMGVTYRAVAARLERSAA